MAKLVAILLALCIGNVYAQTDTIQIDADSKVTVDFNLMILPLKTIHYEYYQAGVKKSINNRISVGMRLGYSMMEFNVIPVERKESLTISAGCDWKLIPDKKWFIDPSLHLMYIAEFDRMDAESYRGGGFLYGINIGYKFKRFGVGIRSQSGYTIGHLNRVKGVPYIGFWHRAKTIDYGLHFTWDL